MAVLTCAHRRLHFESSFRIADVAGDDDFGDRVEAAPAGWDEAYKLDQGSRLALRSVVAFSRIRGI